MSFILTVWQQAAGLPLPRDVNEAQAQLDEVLALPASGPQPVFAAFVRALLARFPDDEADGAAVYDASLDGLEQGPCEAHYNLGLWSGSDAFDAAYAHAVVQANDRGLHLMDGQNGLAFLATGQALALHEPQHGLRAYDALQRGDHAAGWAEYRRLAPLRHPQLLRDWGFMICNGKACRRHMALGAAVAQLSGKDPAGDAELARCLSQVPPAQRALQAQLLAGLRAATDLVAFVDAELAHSAHAVAATRADAATSEAAQALGIPLDTVTRAAAGDRAAQTRLGHALLWHQGTATRGQAQLAAQWLERAASQGEADAQAMLGGALLMGYRAMPIDMARGMALLEQAVAVDNSIGLSYLSDYLHAKSVRAGRKPGTQEQLTDPESVRNQARVLELCTRWAAGGSAMGVFKLAVRLYDGIGAPRDEVAAKAVMQLIKHPTPGLREAQLEEIRRELTEALAMFEPTRDEARAVFNLARELSADLRRMPEVLAKRRAAAQDAVLAAAPRPARASAASDPAPDAARRAPTDARAEADLREPRPVWHLGHLGLLLGAAGFVLLMMLAPSLGKAGVRTLAVAIGAAGAYGVWRCSGDLEWASGKRVLLSLLAMVPMAGFVVCVAVGLCVLRRR